MILYINQLLFDNYIPKNSDVMPYWAINKDETFDYLILGSSRSLSGVNPLIMEKNIINYNNGLNSSLDGTNYPEQYVVLKLILEKNKINNLILLTDVYSFDDSFFSTPFHPYTYFPFIGKYQYVDSVLFDFYKQKTLYWRYIPFYKYADYNNQIGIKQFIASVFFNDNGALLNEKKGYFSNHGIISQELINSIEKYYPKKNITIGEKNNYYFEKIIETCLGNHINIIFINVPEYYMVYQQQINRNEIIQHIIKYSEKYKVPFYNIEKDEFCKNIDNFWNFTHLNAKGAEKFTEMMSIFINNQF